MSVTSVHKDFDTLTLTLIADFDAPAERVWHLWADPRQLERWWGTEDYPATVVEHELTVGGSVIYFMTGPTGEKGYGWWRITSVNPAKSLEFVDGFANEDGTPVVDGPTTTMQVQLTEHDGRTRMQVRSIYSSREHMEEIDRLGATELFTLSIAKMDALLDD
ncbi:SRPBCC family protein [Actinopolymorpha pittospori]